MDKTKAQKYGVSIFVRNAREMEASLQEAIRELVKQKEKRREEMDQIQLRQVRGTGYQA